MAKKYAREQGRSLSDIVENYFKAIAVTKVEKKSNDEELHPLIASMQGSMKAPDSYDYKNELTEILLKKHNLK